MNAITPQIKDYWDRRAPSYTDVIQKNLSDGWDSVWADELMQHFPAGEQLRILDIGTGPGFYAIILAERGYAVTAVDVSEGMLAEARRNAGALADRITFLPMDAQRLDFPDGSFDVIVTRNLTWNLPEPEAAYREWHRVLKPGGVLLNFDADYASNVRHQNQRASAIAETEVYGHCGITPALEKENAAITLSMPASEHLRPQWDIQQLRQIGFSSVGQDAAVGIRILREHDLDDAPMFLVWGIR